MQLIEETGEAGEE